MSAGCISPAVAELLILALLASGVAGLTALWAGMRKPPPDDGDGFY